MEGQSGTQRKGGGELPNDAMSTRASNAGKGPTAQASVASGAPVTTHPRFADRRAAGRELAQALRARALPRPLVLALPRGGVPVAAEVAKVLRAPLDLLLVRKIGAPGQPELAVAAIASQAGAGAPVHMAVDEGLMAATGADQAHVGRGVARERTELERRRRSYLQGRAPQPLRGRTLIVVDDGIATGTTVRAALRALRAVPSQALEQPPTGQAALLQSPPDERTSVPPGSGDEPLGIVLAVPVAPVEVLEGLAGLVDAIVCLWTPPIFHAVGAHYRDFRQVTDEEVTAALNETAHAPAL